MKALKKFEEEIRALTCPIEGRFPRPWMTDLRNPLKAEVFVVGFNQSKGYYEKMLSHDRHVDALFNRNGENCRELYYEMARLAGKGPSQTRVTTGFFVSMLRAEGVSEILETNVICASSPAIADLRSPEYAGGVAQGKVIFDFLLRSIKPRCIVVHGVKARKEFILSTGVDIAPVPDNPEVVQKVDLDGQRIFTIASLSPQVFNQWKKRGWAEPHLRLVAREVATHVLHKGKAR